MQTGWSAEGACWHRWFDSKSDREISRQKGRKVDTYRWLGRVQQVDQQAERQAGWYSHAEKCENINALQTGMQTGSLRDGQVLQDTEKLGRTGGGTGRWIVDI
jgi:hypothetical protein